ncbi:MAG: DUF695 domain-containing protein [Holophagales bacterium]|nr:DUF695 domain-containing protein [Holophagales bacterium]
MSDYRSQSWSNGTGRLGGRAARLRKNVSLDASQQSTHPYALIVNLIYHHLGTDRMPGLHEELERLDRTEEAVADRIVAAYDAHFAMVVTGDGTRDLFLYLPHNISEAEIEQHIEAPEP